MQTSYLTRPRLYRGAALLFVLALLATGLVARAPVLQAAAATLEWSLPPQNLTETGSSAFTPRIAIDPNDRMHIIYGNRDNQLVYINNIAGSFSSPQIVAEDLGANRDRFFDLALAPDGALHVVYSLLGGDERDPQHGYYTKGTLSGATATWSPPVKVTNIGDEEKGYMSSVVVDAAGNAHLSWFDDSRNTYNVGYRVRAADGTLGPVSYPRVESQSENLAKNGQLAITNDGKVHLVYTRGVDLVYARRDGDNWTLQTLSTSRSFNPSLATDGTNLYVTWDAGGISFRRSTDGGNTWSNTIALASSENFNTYPDLAWAAATKQVYLAWSDRIGYPDDSSALDIWYREFDPADGTTTDARQLVQDDNTSAWPELAVGPRIAALTWQEGRDVYLTTAQISAPPPICRGTLTLENGAEATKNSSVTAVITPSDCTPDQMQISVDAPPTDATAKVAYTAQASVTIPTGGCTHTVYIRLFSQNQGGEIFRDSIRVAPALNAAVQAMNPNMAGRPDFTALRPADIAPQNGESGGASDGAPNYTRNRSVVLDVSGSCVNLKSFAVQGSISTTVSGSRYVGAIPLPGGPLTGTKPMVITVTDELDNAQAFSNSIIYDPADTNPATDAEDRLGLPVLDTAQNPAITGPVSATSILVPLEFSNIAVSDNVYGQAEGLAAGRQFWGVWVANSRTNNDENNPNLVWTPVRVASPGTSFRMQWNLFNGLSGEGDVLNRAGTYYVYVRFLDGAGNPSQEVLKTQVTLSEGYRALSVYLPLTGR